LDENDPTFAEFAKILNHFSATEATKKKAGEDDKAGVTAEGAKAEGKEGDKSEEDQKKQSKRQKRMERRLNIAVLKQLVERPDLVEIQDTCAADPWLLLHLKAYRNSVPVPRHWSQKRKYLQGKRGIEKPPFELPDFIKNTGIMTVREAMIEQDEKKKLKQKSRERMQPKMGRLDIDYKVLHDAFFKYQTKPGLTIHGDLYHEGKEFEVSLKQKRPGQLSDELKQALGMPDGAPPPWLINMQRYGPPPSYPRIKLPGLNAPIPPHGQWGYGPGQWGKAPVDELGQPLYGDVFGTLQPPEPTEDELVDRAHWGILPEQEYESSEEEEMPDEDVLMGDEESGTESTIPGVETPANLTVRKFVNKQDQPPPPTQPPPPEAGQPPAELYQTLEPEEVSVGGAAFGASHVYKLGKKAKAVSSSAKKVEIIKSKKTEEFDIALPPEDLELSEAELKKKYENILKEKEKERRQRQVSEQEKEAVPAARKRKATKDKDKEKKKKKKKYSDFKF